MQVVFLPFLRESTYSPSLAYVQDLWPESGQDGLTRIWTMKHFPMDGTTSLNVYEFEQGPAGPAATGSFGISITHHPKSFGGRHLIGQFVTTRNEPIRLECGTIIP